MLGYEEEQVLELFKNTLPTRYYYLLFGIQNLREAEESDKWVNTKERLDYKLAGQSSTPYMSLKTHPSATNKRVMFDQHNLLHNQIDRLTEVLDRMNTRPKGR